MNKHDITNPELYKIDPTIKPHTEGGLKLIRNHNVRIDKIAEMMSEIDADDRILEKLCRNICVTEHSLKSKMAHKHSLSTSVRLNHFCQCRQHNCGTDAEGNEAVCKYCFVTAINNARPTVDMAMARNSFILWNVLIPTAVWRKVLKRSFDKWGEPDFRIQSLGDVRNVTECLNYINLMNAFPEITFTAWSKNWKLWLEAFELVGKPDNMIFIFSSLYLNVMQRIPDAIRPYVDYRFTVFDEDYLKDHPEIVANCCTLQNKGRQCRRDCNECYRKGCTFDRVEIVRGKKVSK